MRSKLNRLRPYIRPVAMLAGVVFAAWSFAVGDYAKSAAVMGFVLYLTMVDVANRQIVVVLHDSDPAAPMQGPQNPSHHGYL